MEGWKRGEIKKCGDRESEGATKRGGMVGKRGEREEREMNVWKVAKGGREGVKKGGDRKQKRRGTRSKERRTCSHGERVGGVEGGRDKEVGRWRMGGENGGEQQRKEGTENSGR